MFSSRLKNIKGTHYDLAKGCLKLSPFFRTIFILDLALSYTNSSKLQNLGRRLYGQIVDIPLGTNYAPLLVDLFFFALKEIS